MEESQHFYVCDGQILKSKEELVTSLQNQMSDDAFKHHCNAEKNDFANWVMGVIGDRKLAKSISKVRTKKTMIKKLKSKKK